jgi:hypothetical protein
MLSLQYCLLRHLRRGRCDTGISRIPSECGPAQWKKSRVRIPVTRLKMNFAVRHDRSSSLILPPETASQLSNGKNKAVLSVTTGGTYGIAAVTIRVLYSRCHENDLASIQRDCIATQWAHSSYSHVRPFLACIHVC